MNVWSVSGKLVCRRSLNLLLWPMDWLIGLLVGTRPRVATSLLCISAGMLVPVLWVVWFQWVGSLVVLLFVPWFWVSIRVSLGAYARAVGGV